MSEPVIGELNLEYSANLLGLTPQNMKVLIDSGAIGFHVKNQTRYCYVFELLQYKEKIKKMQAMGRPK